MVWQDAELVPTKRVNKDRTGGLVTSPLLRRQWNAFGGWQTLYMATFFGFAGSAFGWSQQPGLVAFQKPIMSQAGLKSLGVSGFKAAGPAIVGLLIGWHAFGNPSELRNLLRNSGTYGREMKAVKNELYYQ